MQRRVLYLRASRGDDTILYAHHGPRSFDTGTFRSEALGKATKHFKKVVGLKPKLTHGSVPASVNGATSFIHLGKSLCPGDVCTLYGNRKVYMRGSHEPLVVLVGEAPGAEEEKTGRVFVGVSGKLVDKMLAQSGYRQEYTLINTLLCRPPGNRDPERHEKACCLVRLLAFLDKLSPSAVICVGSHAAQTFFPIAGIKGESNLPVNGIRTVGTPADMRFLHIRHPAYYLRKGGLNTKNKKIKEEIEEAIYAMRLVREISSERPLRPGWSWLDKVNPLLKRELSKGDLLVPADSDK